MRNRRFRNVGVVYFFKEIARFRAKIKKKSHGINLAISFYRLIILIVCLSFFTQPIVLAYSPSRKTTAFPTKPIQRYQKNCNAIVHAMSGSWQGYLELAPDSWSVVPPHQEGLEVLDWQPKLVAMVIQGVLGFFSGPRRPQPRLISIPVDLLPRDLIVVLEQIRVEPLTGGSIDAYEYLKRYTDEIIFCPYIMRVDDQGVIRQGSGMVCNRCQSVSNEHVTCSNAHRRGKRVFYLSCSALLDRNGKPVHHLNQLSDAVYPKAQEHIYSFVEGVIEESVHRETMSLVAAGALPAIFWDPPRMVWAEKIAKTISLKSLEDVRLALKRTGAIDDQRTDALINRRIVHMRSTIAACNRILDLPPDDVSLPPASFAQAKDLAEKRK